MFEACVGAFMVGWKKLQRPTVGLTMAGDRAIEVSRHGIGRFDNGETREG